MKKLLDKTLDIAFAILTIGVGIALISMVITGLIVG